MSKFSEKQEAIISTLVSYGTWDLRYPESTYLGQVFYGVADMARTILGLDEYSVLLEEANTRADKLRRKSKRRKARASV